MTDQISPSALDAMIANLENSRRVGWARAFAAEAALATANASPPTSYAPTAERRLRLVCGWFKPIYYALGWHYERVRWVTPPPDLSAEELAEWAREFPVQAAGTDYQACRARVRDDGKMLAVHAPRPDDWIAVVAALLDAGLTAATIEQTIVDAMGSGVANDYVWAYFRGSCLRKLRGEPPVRALIDI